MPPSNAETKITRLSGEGRFDLIAPEGYHASVLLRFISQGDGCRRYAWWVMVGRHYMESISVSYNCTATETIRVDLPDNTPLSQDSVLKPLKAFLAKEAPEPDEGPTPIIVDE